MELVKYNITNSAIAKIKDEYMPLMVDGVEDIEGFNKVVVARKVVKSKRIQVEAERKDLKLKALNYGRKVDTEAKRITALLAPIEEHLTQQEDIIKKEKERIKVENERLKQENHNNQLSQIIEAGAVFNGSSYCYDTSFITDSEIWLLNTEGFSFLIEKIELWKKMENVRIAEEDSVRKIEHELREKIAEKMRIQQVEIDKKQALIEKIDREQAEQSQKLKLQQDKFDEEKRERENQKNIDEAKIEAEEAAKIKFEEKAKAESIRLENENIESEKKEKEKKIREEKLRPDQEKICSFVDTLRELTWPEVKSDEAMEIIKEAMISMQDFTLKLRKEAILKL